MPTSTDSSGIIEELVKDNVVYLRNGFESVYYEKTARQIFLHISSPIDNYLKNYAVLDVLSYLAKAPCSIFYFIFKKKIDGIGRIVTACRIRLETLCISAAGFQQEQNVLVYYQIQIPSR